MGIAPCLRCDERFTGPALNAYLTSYSEDQRERYRFVVCLQCHEALVQPWRDRALFDDGNGQWEWHQPELDGMPRLRASEPQEQPSRRRRGS